MHPAEKLFAEQFMRNLAARNPGEPEFHQAVQEVVESLVPVLERHTKYLDHRILERIVEPERVIHVPRSLDRRSRRDSGQQGLSRRVQLRPRPIQGRAPFPPHRQSRNPQVPRIRTDLQELVDHPPHGWRQGRIRLRSQGQVRQRGHAFLPELHDRTCRHIGPDTDIPAGDIGVGGREIGFMFGQYKRLRNASKAS